MCATAIHADLYTFLYTAPELLVCAARSAEDPGVGGPNPHACNGMWRPSEPSPAIPIFRTTDEGGQGSKEQCTESGGSGQVRLTLDGPVKGVGPPWHQEGMTPPIVRPGLWPWMPSSLASSPPGCLGPAASDRRSRGPSRWAPNAVAPATETLTPPGPPRGGPVCRHPRLRAAHLEILDRRTRRPRRYERFSPRSVVMLVGVADASLDLRVVRDRLGRW
jgi:hypothetical protein